uniref:5'-3' exoribonuclease 3-like isoform X1 n=1 Tax=Fragaria vesca subsp. vesca TaxID=101020 RepID=UPI0005C9A7E0|nr:PREDICTED: 5'-3' exoribonuclease 3-like isoform X1 [Fragaria vesca subsp. vesca]
MGVPSFFRWLVNKYPKVVVKAIEEIDEFVDPTSPNPNGIEFDNLYLDMNGIIHPCFHPEEEDDDGHGHGLPLPRTYEDVFNNIFEYIDRLFRIVRPRKLLYMAIDGVAPRAKMNQQRSRRFKSAMDKNLAEAEEEKLRLHFEKEGKKILLEQESEISDSNIITPGTDFMYKLSKALQSYTNLRLSQDPGWKDIKVILSDANVPGEGEHKVMSFIRHQRTVPSYDPNTRHCLYGLDADLIMLSLATHEVHFSILREDLLLQNQQPYANGQLTASSDKRKAYMMKKPYQFLHIWILREYLELDMQINDPPENFKFDLERIIDDFIFICFFAGNDFLPHMPTLEIHEGAIDLLMQVYKKEFKKIGGYLVDMIRVHDKKLGYIKLSRVEKFILLIGAYEEKIFKKRSDIRDRKLRGFCNNDDTIEEEIDAGSSTSNVKAIEGSAVVSADNLSSSEIAENTKEYKQKLKASIRRKSDLFRNGDHFGTDKVRLGATGFKERYYKYKFSAETPGEIECKRKEVVKCYTEGLLWVLLYYFSGPPSWKWFYPFHYGPFASDMKGLAQVKPQFEKGSPFKPIDTLMAVLPPRSAHALPEDYRALMMEDCSSIIEFYPSDFEVDMDGKRFTWQGISKLPFIDESRLLHETRKLEKELKGEEIERNAEKLDRLFIRSSHIMASQIVSLTNGGNQSIKIDPNLSFGISDFIRQLDDNDAKVKGDDSSEEDPVLCALYELPNTSLHMPRLLDGLQLPPKTINECELLETVLWHECQGNATTHSLQQGQARFKKPNDFGNISFQNNTRLTSGSPANSIHKFAGSGWGCGRGRANGSTSGDQNYAPKTTSSDQREVSSSSSYYAKGTTSDHKNEGTLQHGFRNLKISDSGQGWRPTGRGFQPLNNVFWPSRSSASQDRNFASYGSQSYHARGRGRDQHNSWQQTYPIVGTGRGQQDPWTHTQPPFSASRSSSHAGGRGNFQRSDFSGSGSGR